MSVFSRRITEALPQGFLKGLKRKELAPHLLNYLTLFLIILSAFLLFFLGMVYLSYTEAQQERRMAQDNLSYWQDVVKKHPNFTDGYYNAGLYAAELKDYKTSVEFLDRAIALDPQFKKAIDLEKRIEGK